MGRWLLLIFLFGTTPLAAQQMPLLFPTSAAAGDNLLGVLDNPAALGQERGSEVFLFGRRNDGFPDLDSRTEYGVLLGEKGVGLGWQSLYDPTAGKNRNRFQVVSAFPLGHGVFLGSRWQVLNRFQKMQNQLDAGLIVRPWPFLSLGLQADNLTRRNHGFADYTAGVALRPLKNQRLTLGADLHIFRPDADTYYGDTLNYRFFAQAEPWPGLSLAAVYTTGDQRLQLGLEVTSEFTSLFASQFVANSDYDYNQTGFGIHLTEKRRHGPKLTLGAPRLFVEIPLRGAIPEYSPLQRFSVPGNQV